MRKLSIIFAFLLSYMGGVNSAWADELTVCDGTTTSNYVPYIYYFDDFTKSQYVIPAEDLEVMSGGVVSSIKLYTNSQNVPYTTASTVDVFLKEVNYTSISSFETKNGDDIVYQGTLDIVSADGGGELTITFSKPFTYNGSNLLIGIENTTDAQYKGIYFYGKTVNGASISGYNSSSLDNVTSGTQRNFIPKTTFTYTVSSDPAITPTDLVTDNVTYKSATLNWTNGGSENKWQIRYKAEGDADYTNTGDISEKPYILTNLAAETKYYVSIRSKMRASDYSDWSDDIEFTTPATPIIAVPTGLAAKNITSTTANLSWTSSESAWQIKYKAEGDADYCDPIDVTTNPYAIAGLTANTKYYVSICAIADELSSLWSEDTEFTTVAVGPAPGGTTILTEDFESGWSYKSSSPYTLNSIKEGWGYATGYSLYKIHSGSDYGYTGNGLYVSASSNTGYIIMPAVKAGSTISFYAKTYDTSTSGSKKAQLYKATKNGETYTVDTSVNYADITTTGSWTQYTSSTISDGGYVAIRLLNAAIDDIVYTIEAPIISMVTDNYGYTTFSCDQALDLTTENMPEGLEAYKAAVNGTKVNLTKLDQTVPANTGILLKGNANTEYQIATATTSTTVEGNDFLATDGTSVVTSDETNFIFVMKKNQETLTFSKYVGTAALPVNKAYLVVPAANFDGGNARLSFTFEEGEATGIATAEGASRMNDGAVYNLQGQKVEKAQKDLYIVNGKKYVVK